MSIRPIERPATAVDRVTAQLRRAIATGELGAGHALPPERELAVGLGVSRLTARAALARLTGSGIVQVRHGSGYLVGDPWRDGGIDLAIELLVQASAEADRGEPARLVALAGELLAVRRALAGVVLGRLAESPARSLAGFDGALAALAAAAARGATPAELAELDLGIIAELTRLAGSFALALCLGPVARALTAAPRLTAAIYAAPDGNLAGYRALRAAIVSGQATALAGVADLLLERDRATLATLELNP